MQDQAAAIVIEMCEANKLKQIDPEIHHVCLLLVQAMEMALNLELCVLQICGIRPVLGRVEDFSKEVKLLIKGKNPFILPAIIQLEFQIHIEAMIIRFFFYSNRRACVSQSINEIIGTYNITRLSGIAINHGLIPRNIRAKDG